ncbi:C-1-tetrahydrofolate synthase, cytoplasmic-like isoform X2 [Temnothorax curvispinosus]|nr:C-1-tetrahydrofolate synthase, cytoplasmic-like isoform X2 [Temnothorax curvispinosus]XP_024893905.1 C-1-tetrahydrofolate synthase, cytoplasmic-like isoform X2 [Temnothorax curvispinosus]XP_024893906.1 C-1-tetrahydrofolate synthase, cytoplasmic-like isoform X2 [Temnothorax curvispinosus]
MSTDVRGVILSGVELAREIRQGLIRDVSTLKEKLPDFTPGLAIVQVGAREDSNVYIKMKTNAAREIGIDVQRCQLPNTTTEIELINKVSKLNNDPNVHGIIVQMPLDSVNKINSHLITDLVSPDKDVDG